MKEEKNYYHTEESHGAKITESHKILSPKKQKEIASYLEIDIKNLSPEKAQEKIDNEIAKKFGIRAVAVVTLGSFEKAKFILIKQNVKKDELWLLAAGRVEYHKELAGPFKKTEDKVEIRGGGIIKIDKAGKRAIIYGKSYDFGKYSKKEIEEFKDTLKHQLNVKDIEIQLSGDYHDY